MRAQLGLEGKSGTYNTEDVMREMPQLPVLKYQHKKAKNFRNMMLDTKTQRAYLRDKKDVNRTMRYQCLVCAANHDFKLNKCGGQGMSAPAGGGAHG